MNLKKHHHEAIKRMLRINHSGELGANYIYSGQHKVFPTAEIQHMWDQEKVHLSSFDKILVETRTRPSIFRVFWEASGFAMGYLTAKLSHEGAMACTEAVETVIGHHYNDQIRELLEISKEYPKDERADLEELIQLLSKFRDEELEHKEIAIENNAKGAAGYDLLSKGIQGICHLAIRIAKHY